MKRFRENEEIIERINSQRYLCMELVKPVIFGGDLNLVKGVMECRLIIHEQNYSPQEALLSFLFDFFATEPPQARLDLAYAAKMLNIEPLLTAIYEYPSYARKRLMIM